MNVVRQKRVQDTVASLRAGRPIIVIGEPRSAGAEVVIGAENADPDWVAWAVRYTSGFLCAAMRSERADELNLPALGDPEVRRRGAPVYGVGVDAAEGVGTGISAIDRARTARVLAAPHTTPDDLTRPGHVLPIRTARRGVVQHRGTAEAAVDLCTIANLAPVAVTGTLLADTGELLEGQALADFADRHQMETITVDELADDILRNGVTSAGRLQRLEKKPVELGADGPFLIDLVDSITGATHTVLMGDEPSGDTVAAYVITACERWENDPTPADADGCGGPENDLKSITQGGGIVIYLRDTSEYFMTDKCELARGAVVAALHDLSIGGAWIVGWPDGTDRGTTRFVDCSVKTDQGLVVAS